MTARNDARAAALAAYWRFFEGFNSRAPASWAAGLNFPHARISPHGALHIVETAEAHTRDMSWQRVEASGWHHSVGAEPTVVHVAADCVHVVGGWSRYTRDDRLIMTNHVGYVITRVPVGAPTAVPVDAPTAVPVDAPVAVSERVDRRDHWGMQARFGVDPGPDGLTDRHAALAVRQLLRFLGACTAGDSSSLRATSHLPFLLVRPGGLDLARTMADLANAAPALGRIAAVDLRAVQAAPRAVNVAVGRDGSPSPRALVFVVERAGRWGVQAVSVVA